jgi:hypothetical protein
MNFSERFAVLRLITPGAFAKLGEKYLEDTRHYTGIGTNRAERVQPLYRIPELLLYFRARCLPGRLT